MEFRHIGVPTKEKREGEAFLEDLKVYVSGPGDDPFMIEWLRYLEDSPMPEELQNGIHIAYEVDDIAAAMEGKRVLMEPFYPMEGVTVAFVMHEGVPVEFMEVAKD